MMVELRSRIFREPREESGTYVAAPTPETPRQHINLPEIPSRCPHLCATHSFDGDCAKRLLDHQLEYGVHFPERRNAHSSHHRRTIMHAGESAPAMTQIEKVRYTAKTQTTGGRVNGAARSSDCHLEITLATPGTAGSGTNSERLFAAGWSACFEGAMEIAARKMRITLPADLAIDAEVELCTTDGAYFLQARLDVSVPGVEREVAQTLVSLTTSLTTWIGLLRELIRWPAITTAKRIFWPTLSKNLGRFCRKAHSCTLSTR